MKIIQDISEMAAFARELKREGKTIAFIPTMGCLHDGHLDLIKAGADYGNVRVVSIFVNPTQFNDPSDYQNYPIALEKDIAVLKSAQVDILFIPEKAALYPDNYQTYVDVTTLTDGMCGANRPGHFRGVTTIVTKLFNIVCPDTAIFGEKDFQQLAVIRRMVRDLNMNIQIISRPTVRESDGLALSSRNKHLCASDREKALSLSRGLFKAGRLYSDGASSTQDLINAAKDEIVAGVEIEYMEIRDSMTLEPLDIIDKRAVFAIAAKVGRTRLIDNIILQEEDHCKELC